MKPLPVLSFFFSLDVIFFVPMQFQVKGTSKHFLPTRAPEQCDLTAHMVAIPSFFSLGIFLS